VVCLATAVTGAVIGLAYMGDRGFGPPRRQRVVAEDGGLRELLQPAGAGPVEAVTRAGRGLDRRRKGGQGERVRAGATIWVTAAATRARAWARSPVAGTGTVAQAALPAGALPAAVFVTVTFFAATFAGAAIWVTAAATRARAWARFPVVGTGTVAQAALLAGALPAAVFVTVTFFAATFAGAAIWVTATATRARAWARFPVVGTVTVAQAALLAGALPAAVFVTVTFFAATFAGALFVAAVSFAAVLAGSRSVGLAGCTGAAR
jgi:hypothetical protein